METQKIMLQFDLERTEAGDPLYRATYGIMLLEQNGWEIVRFDVDDPQAAVVRRPRSERRRRQPIITTSVPCDAELNRMALDAHAAGVPLHGVACGTVMSGWLVRYTPREERPVNRMDLARKYGAAAAAGVIGAAALRDTYANPNERRCVNVSPARFEFDVDGAWRWSRCFCGEEDRARAWVRCNCGLSPYLGENGRARRLHHHRHAARGR